jgi:subtilase family serine protease
VTFYVAAESVGYAVIDSLDCQAGSDTANASVWWVPTGGEYRVYAFADYPISHVLESNERNNDLSASLPPLNIVYGDLRITDFALWPPTGRVQAGDPVYAFLTVRNDSPIDIPAAIPVDVQVDGKVVAEDSVDGLGPNEAKTIRVPTAS